MGEKIIVKDGKTSSDGTKKKLIRGKRERNGNKGEEERVQKQILRRIKIKLTPLVPSKFHVPPQQRNNASKGNQPFASSPFSLSLKASTAGQWRSPTDFPPFSQLYNPEKILPFEFQPFQRPLDPVLHETVLFAAINI